MASMRRFANLFRRARLDEEIDAELMSHIEMRTADNIAAGMSAEEGRRDAVLRFGNRGTMKERVASADAQMFFDSLWRDVHYAARQLRRSPVFAITAVLTLALGIGANVVVFGVLNALVLRPLDVPKPAGLYGVVHQEAGYDNQSYPDYVDFRSRNSTFADMAAYRIMPGGFTKGTEAYKCWYLRVSGNYFDMLGVQPEQGRLFHESDEHGPNSAPYIVLSYQFFRAHFGGDPRTVGSVVEVNKHPFTVIGVAPSTFHGSDLFIWPDFWMPMVDSPDDEGTDFLSRRTMHNIWVIGRLKPGVNAQQATDNLNVVARQMAKEYPQADDGLGARLVKPGLLGDMFGDPARSFLAGIMVLAILVLLAACANLASLFAARTADRSRELAIRLAIGSSRWHVMRQLLSEAVVVSLIGGLTGTVFATILLRVLTHWQPFAEFPVHVTVAADARVYAVAFLLSVASGLVFGVLPGRQAWRTSAAEVMKGGERSVMGFRRFAMRDLLLGVQIALCTLLVTASLVAFRGMQRSLHAPLGFQPEGVVLAETDLHMAGYTDESSVRVQKRMIEEAGRIPGVTAVGTVNGTPLGTGGSSAPVYRAGTTDFRSANELFAAKYFSISPGYLEAARTRLVTGRDFTWQDDAKSPSIALVNETFASRMFPNSSAIGQRFMMGPKHEYEIVGVVEDGKYDSLTESPWAAVFFPVAQGEDSDTTVVVRSALAGGIAPQVRQVLAKVDPNVPFTIHSWPDALAFVLFPARIATAVLGIMGLLGAMLAVTGVFGMATYSVSKRMKELGIRVALGAQPARLMMSAVGRSMVLLAVGSATGLVLGVMASRLLAAIVYEATPRDPFVFAGVVVTMTVLGLLALCLPAQRALRIHPAGLLREE
jgi:predicted permease